MLSVAFFSPPARLKNVARIVVIPSSLGNALNTETGVWTVEASALRWWCGGGVKRCLPPSATFFPAGVYTGPTAPETNHFARHGLYCIYYIGTRPPALARCRYSVLWSIP